MDSRETDGRTTPPACSRATQSASLKSRFSILSQRVQSFSALSRSIGKRPAKRCPGIDHLPPALECIATPIGPLHGTSKRMGQRRLCKFRSEVRLVADPVTKRTAEAMYGVRLRLQPPHHHLEGHPAQWPRRFLARETRESLQIHAFPQRSGRRAAPTGTRCARPAFIRSAGMVQINWSMSNSSQRAARSLPSRFLRRASPDRQAVKMTNSRLRADTELSFLVF